MGILETKQKGGRKTDYLPSFCDEADIYIAKCQDSFEEFHKTRGDKSDTYERSINVELPTIEGFSQHLHCSRDVIYDWVELYPDFQQAIDRIKAEQKKRLLNKGLGGGYNSTIAKLVLSANHNMHEKTESDVNVKLPQPILDTVLPNEDVPADNSDKENPTPA